MAVSVNTVVERSYNHQINAMIAQYVPSLAEAVTRTFALAEASKLRSLFDEASFVDFTTDTVRHAFVLPSFDAYYGPFERGGCSTGQALTRLSADMRRAVREEAQRDLGDTGGPVKPEAKYRIASGQRRERETGRLTQSDGRPASYCAAGCFDQGWSNELMAVARRWQQGLLLMPAQGPPWVPLEAALGDHAARHPDDDAKRARAVVPTSEIGSAHMSYELVAVLLVEWFEIGPRSTLPSLETRPVIGKRCKVELNDERHLNDLREADSLPQLRLPLRPDERMRQRPIADCLRATVKCRGDVAEAPAISLPP